MGANLKSLPITILSGASLSNAALIGDHVFVGLQMPAAWTAASMTFQVSDDDGVTWHNLYDDGGNEVTINPTTPAGLRLAITPDAFGGVTFLKIRSGTSGAPVVQGADRALTVITRKLFPIR
jgi:hypothetical protein